MEKNAFDNFIVTIIDLNNFPLIHNYSNQISESLSFKLESGSLLYLSESVYS